MASLIRSNRPTDEPNKPSLLLHHHQHHPLHHRPNTQLSPSVATATAATYTGRSKRGNDASPVHSDTRDSDALKPKRARIAIELPARSPQITPAQLPAQTLLSVSNGEVSRATANKRARTSGGGSGGGGGSTMTGQTETTTPKTTRGEATRLNGRKTKQSPTQGQPKQQTIKQAIAKQQELQKARQQQQQQQQQQQEQLQQQSEAQQRQQQVQQQQLPQVIPQQPRKQEPDDEHLTKHQSKVRKGIQHELDRLQPQPVDATETRGGRKLRSQEATRFKSELSAYFPDYDEMVGNDPKEDHLITVDTPIVVTDTGSLPYPSSYPVRGYGDALFTDIVDAQRIDFSFLTSHQHAASLTPPVDPLPDSAFTTIHKRAARLERSIRNTEKGRAQHEKDQIIRLLEGLQGHDWLRVMGISGVTDTKKKTFEPAREYFIKGCEGIIAKFRNWSIEERRRKLEKERLAAEEAEEEDSEEDEDADEEDGARRAHGSSEASTATSDISSPAQQLREEALAHSRTLIKLKRPPRRPSQSQSHPPRPLAPPPPPKEFVSFFAKRHERDHALNPPVRKRANRKVTTLAFGLPVPELEDREFDLPLDYRDEETMRIRARKKRKEKRSSRV